MTEAELQARRVYQQEYRRRKKSGEPFIRLRRESRPLADRIWEKIDKTDTCWLWTGSRTKAGYGHVNGGARGVGNILVHRWMHEQYIGLIPDGLHIDHLCRVRHCVNPAHIEAVTPRENVLRGEAPTVRLHRAGVCAQGHPLIEHRFPSGVRRICLECRRLRRGPVITRWARKHDRCVTCGTNEVRHLCNGRCVECHKKAYNESRRSVRLSSSSRSST